MEALSSPSLEAAQGQCQSWEPSNRALSLGVSVARSRKWAQPPRGPSRLCAGSTPVSEHPTSSPPERRSPAELPAGPPAPRPPNPGSARAAAAPTSFPQRLPVASSSRHRRAGGLSSRQRALITSPRCSHLGEGNAVPSPQVKVIIHLLLFFRKRISY